MAAAADAVLRAQRQQQSARAAAEAEARESGDGLGSSVAVPVPEENAASMNVITEGKGFPYNLPYQQKVFEVYSSTVVQMVVAAMIFANFIVSALNKQILPMPDSPEDMVFYIFEWFFMVVFTFELFVNVYGSWFVKFWKSGWNWFDFVIVAVSAISLFWPEMPGVTVLRLFRAFRVFRLFKRVPSLRKIVEGVIVSLPGVGNAFIILGLIMAIWSIIGVEFFGEFQPEEFGTFLKGMLTMYQVMTLDSWASGIARPLIYQHEQYFAAVFFVSYVFIAGVVLTNVVVAILLEKFIGATSEDEPAAPVVTETVPEEVPTARKSSKDERKRKNSGRSRTPTSDVNYNSTFPVSPTASHGDAQGEEDWSDGARALRNEDLRKGIQLVLQGLSRSEVVFQKGQDKIISRMDAFNSRLTRVEKLINATAKQGSHLHPNVISDDGLRSYGPLSSG
mmetsp:Transcript_145797/g.254550  ORF Transcript_145797/g.254550 Transcript_145797/m.254550 type:complete len:449 (-) Transcript_145797:1288-2634(-)